MTHSHTVSFSALQLKTVLLEIPGWDAKVTVAADVLFRNTELQKNPKPTIEEIALASRAFHQFLLCGNSYKPRRKFRGDVCLIKASKLRKRALTLPDDYGLSSCISGKVNIHTVDGTHEDFLMGRGALACADIINSIAK